MLTPAQILAKFDNDVLELISTSTAHKASGNRDGEMSVSYLMDGMRLKGWKGLGTSSNFEEMLEVSGFTLRRVYKGVNLVRTYVTI